MPHAPIEPRAAHASEVAAAPLQHEAAGAEALAQVIALHSKSFALAAKLLPKSARADAIVLYAYCRRADDRIDLAPAGEQLAELHALRRELDAIYAPAPASDPLDRELQRVVRTRQIPRMCLDELLAGFEMDVVGQHYETWEDLLQYCVRVAGTVGWMMCHVMGVHDPRALGHAGDLGIAMQLTNICRDVREDWERGRVYLPRELLAEHGAVLSPRAGQAPGVAHVVASPVDRSASFPVAAAPQLARVVEVILARADHYYQSGDAGLHYLSPRCRWAIRCARLVYSAIGRELHARGCDPLAARAVVPRWRKLWYLLRAGVEVMRYRSPVATRRLA